MKVLQVHNYYQQPGGEDAVVAAERTLLQSRGHQVIQYLKHNDDVEQIPHLQLLQKTLFNRESEHEFRDLLARETPDLIHSHNTFPLISPSIYFAASQAGIPVVQTLHNFRLLCPSATLFRDGAICEDCVGRIPWPAVIHACYRGNRSASAVTAAMITAHRALGTWRHRIHSYIALSEYSKSKFVEGGLPANKIAVKSNFLPEDPGVGDGAGGYAVFAGRLAREKGLSTLLDAWTRLQIPVQLKIAGNGDLMPWLLERTARLENVEVLGHLAHPEILHLIKQAAMLVMPSEWYEAGVPLTIIEAFGCGTPVLASNLPSLDNVVVNGVNGFQFTTGSARSLADRITALWRDPASLLQMRTAARKTFETRYSSAANYTTLSKIYKQASKNKPTNKNSGTNIRHR